MNPRLSRPITRYLLVVPVDPTPDEQSWFEELTDGAPFVVSFRGRPHWDSLAAKHPHVIDYLIGGGRDQVRQRAKALLGAALDPTRPLNALDIAASLEMLRTRLNLEDPYYRYHFLTSDITPNAAQIEDCVVAETHQVDDGSFLTIKVIPRHRYSLDDEPIQGTMTVKVADPVKADAFRAAFQGFTDFGRALDLPEGSLFAILDLPGGLGGEVVGGGGRIGPALVDNPPGSWRLAIRDGGDQTILELELRTTSLTRGAAGGAELHAAHASGALQVNLLLRPPVGATGELTFNVSLNDPTGRPVLEVVEPIRFMSLLHIGHRLVLLGRYGPKPLASHEFDSESSLVPTAVARHIDDLATIQAFADFPIVVPERIDLQFARDVHDHARMIRGEVLTGSWDEITLNLKAGVDRKEVAGQFAQGGPFMAEEERLGTIDDRAISLGRFSTSLADARLADEQPASDEQLRLVPGSTHTMTRRRSSAT